MSDDPIDAGRRSALRGVAALGATPLASLGGAAADAGTPRERLLAYVDRTPGAHFSKIRDDLDLGTGETQHHLRRLERAETVATVRDGEYRRFFIANRFAPFEQQALVHLRKETPRRVLIALLRSPGQRGTDLAAALDRSPPTISRALGSLADAGLVEREPNAVRRPETVLTLVVRYADSFGHEARELAATADDLLQYDRQP